MTDLLNSPAIIGEAVAGETAKRAAAVRIELEHLNSIVTDSTFDIAELLVEVKEKQYYGAWGYQTFEEYVEVVLGMKRRTAYYHISIVTKARALEIPRSEYEDIQITKLKEIFTLNPFDKEGNEMFSPVTGGSIGSHIRELVRTAKDTPLSQVEEVVAKIKGQTGDEEMVFMSLKVTKSCRDNVILPARELARKRLGSQEIDKEGDAHDYTDSVVEEMIHAEFLADPNNVDAPPQVMVESKDEQVEPSDADLEDIAEGRSEEGMKI